MSLETRSSSALFKRAEQLRRWEESETNRVPALVNGRTRKIKFSAGCVFLAACKAGDRDEILRLLKKGADIDTHDVDGLSALHQACIDDNLELVEFLVENGADVNKGDNEGWTPLHATASCGFLSIARYLIEKGANVAAVNNDGELPVDVAESDEMEDMLQQQIEELGIDADNARTEEERLMLADAKNWLSSGYLCEKPHPKTGAMALHVSAAKGYLKVMDILIKAGADVDAQDLDGWTPLHAAAHWGQKEAAEVLAEAHCDMNIRNCVGQTAFDVAETEMVRVLEELKKKQSTLPKDNNINRKKNINKISTIQKPLISDGLESKGSDKEDESENSSSDKVPSVQKVELKIHSQSANPESSTKPHETQSSVESDDDDHDDDDDVDSLSTETSDTGNSTDVSDEESNSEKKNRVNKEESQRLPSLADINKTVPNSLVQNSKVKQQNETEEALSWRRPGSFRSRLQDQRPNISLKIGEKESPTGGSLPGDSGTSMRPPNAKSETPQEVVLRRTQSFEADEKFYRRYLELRAKINAGNSCPTLHSTPVRSASLKERRVQAREEGSRLGLSTPSSTTVTPVPVGTTVSPTTTSPQAVVPVRSVTPSTPSTPGGSKLSPANIFKNFFKSFVPPVRDEESETQRKAHAKRVRETRRSTQGVTLEEIKSAEQLVKKKQQQVLQQASQQLGNSEPTDEVVVKVHNVAPSSVKPPSSPEDGGPTSPVVSATLTKGNVSTTDERRPSWRLRVDNGSKFMLEDARKEGFSTNNAADVVRKTAVVTPVTETGDTTVTLPLRKRGEEKDPEKEKENESRNAQATQAAIQRRRRPKRRSTGVVHVDMDEIDPERQSDTSGGLSPSGEDNSNTNNLESGDDSEATSRLKSVIPGVNNSNSSHERVSNENGEIIDYKKLYEESLVENDRLREKLRQTEEELKDAKTTSEKNALLASRNSLSEAEKRERRAMERKLSEMEEELKQLEQLKCENQRLKDENGALIRVISKLSK
ncbi:protein phosphatase 1 regulatory subunit 12A isoform X2 [Halyomorpha halys]|uniref:protein phosphatase 1 regulatory subunit 12A isoform X2 n=1 Tax=Halyomorpha halys TaxID=286706 RepID=UPI0006D506EF|nr:protein phosphatase 1 regulatory subunit 12A isoform X2 [Halyomorpha halys]